MYPLNDHLQAAHERLLLATSDEGNTDAPANDRDALAQYYGGWEPLPQAPPSPHVGVVLTPNHTLGLPHEDYGFFDRLDSVQGSSKLYESISTAQQLVRSSVQYRLPTPTLPNDGLRSSSQHVAPLSPR